MGVTAVRGYDTPETVPALGFVNCAVSCGDVKKDLRDGIFLIGHKTKLVFMSHFTQRRSVCGNKTCLIFTWSQNAFSICLNLAEVGSLRSSVNVSFNVVLAGSCNVTAGCSSSLMGTVNAPFSEIGTHYTIIFWHNPSLLGLKFLPQQPMASTKETFNPFWPIDFLKKILIVLLDLSKLLVKLLFESYFGKICKIL